jgi:hypothetical protein
MFVLTRPECQRSKQRQWDGRTDTKEANSMPIETKFWVYVGAEYQILLQDTVLHKNHPTIYLLT